MNKLKKNLLHLIDKLFHLRLEQSETKVVKEQDKAKKKVKEVKKVLKKVNKLQTKLIKKTVTYYIGKAQGVQK